MDPHYDEDMDIPPSAQQPPSCARAPYAGRGSNVRTSASISTSTSTSTLRGSHRPISTTTTHGSRLAMEGLVATIAKTTSTSHAGNTHPIVSRDRSHHAPSTSLVPSASSSTVSKPSVPSTSAPPSAAPPTRTFFDPWNSSSTGHQRAENRLSGSTSWRDSRDSKLREQYRGGLSGGAKRVADTVGAGSKEFGKDGRKANGGWEPGARGLRGTAQKSLVEIWGASKAGKGDSKLHDVRLDGKAEASNHPDDQDGKITTWSQNLKNQETEDYYQPVTEINPGESFSKPAPDDKLQQPKRIFEGLCFYLNGSTAPLVGDHKLKQLLAERGANMSIALGRRSVTHVIIGTPNSRHGCGGGLAATKIQKEITRTGGKGVKFVSVEWVLSSIAADRRLPESRFASSTVKLAPRDQSSVYVMLRRAP